MIGQSIKWHLEVNGCSQYKLAARLGVSRSVITELTKDSANPTFYTLQRIAKALGIKVSDIVKTAERLKEEK